MEASLKFRENQNPILKSKIPLKILTFPFRSSVEASADSKELCLSFSSFWESGPLFKLNYRPNDPTRPFGLVLKTGIGSLGSPVGAPFTISAGYNFAVNSNENSSSTRSPSFYVNFKPRIGDFEITGRVIPKIQLPSQGSPGSLVPVVNNENGAAPEKSDEASEKMTWTKLISGGFAAAEDFIGKEEVCARTVVPVMDWAAVKLRWGLRFPAAENEGRWGKMPLPVLVLNKIGIEQMARGKMGRERDLRGTDDVEETCLDLEKELSVLKRENGLIMKDLEDFKSEIGGWKFEKTGASINNKRK